MFIMIYTEYWHIFVDNELPVCNGFTDTRRHAIQRYSMVQSNWTVGH